LTGDALDAETRVHDARAIGAELTLATHHAVTWRGRNAREVARAASAALGVTRHQRRAAAGRAVTEVARLADHARARHRQAARDTASVYAGLAIAAAHVAAWVDCGHAERVAARVPGAEVRRGRARIVLADAAETDLAERAVEIIGARDDDRPAIDDRHASVAAVDPTEVRCSASVGRVAGDELPGAATARERNEGE